MKGYEPARGRIREALCALGNGYFATRGAATWGAGRMRIHYPGPTSPAATIACAPTLPGRVVENEDLVNLPNWLALNFRIEDGAWFDKDAQGDARWIPTARSSIYTTACCFRALLELCGSSAGRRTHVERAPARVHALTCTSGCARTHSDCRELVGRRDLVCSAIDGRVVNAGAKLYRKFSNQHLEPLAAEGAGGRQHLVTPSCVPRNRTSHRAGVRALGRFFNGRGTRQPSTTPHHPGAGIYRPGYSSSSLAARPDTRIGEDRFTLQYFPGSCHLGKWPRRAQELLARAGDFEIIDETSHVHAWQRLWRRFDIHRGPQVKKSFKLNMPMLLRLQHVPSATGRIATLDRARHRCARPRLDRRALPGAYLLGRALHLPFSQLPLSGDHTLAPAISLGIVAWTRRWLHAAKAAGIGAAQCPMAERKRWHRRRRRNSI